MNQSRIIFPSNIAQTSAMKLFGVTVKHLPRERCLRAIRQALYAGSFTRIATLNPEFLLQAREVSAFRMNLNQADIHAIDGGGLLLAFWRQGVSWSGRVTGGEIVDLLCREVSRRSSSEEIQGKAGFSIGIVAREDGLSTLEAILAVFRKQYPGTIFHGASLAAAGRPSIDGLTHDQQAALRGCRVVLCGLGAPGQEYFTESLRRQPGDIRIAVGVGGVFDVLTGLIKQAPQWLSKAGLEWLWRLFQQPNRIARIFRAIIVFPVHLFKRYLGGSAPG